MLRSAAVWYHVLKGVGPAMRAGRTTDRIFRHYVLETLRELGLFEYLKEPRTYGQILTGLDLADTSYTRDLFEILSTDKQKVLVRENDTYRATPDFEIPSLETILGTVPKRYHTFTLLAKSMAHAIPNRLRAETVVFSDSLQVNGRQYLAMFDKVLADRSYTALRESALAILTREDRQWLKGKSLLDVGCGSGRESAHLWLAFGGAVSITGVDPVEGLIEIAGQSFGAILDEMDLLHPPVTPDNRPEFKVGSAIRLPFEDDTFDAAFHSQMLHWTPDPHRSVEEIVRVVKPGGLIFGTQTGKPYANPYFDLLIRTSENSSGFFWMEEFGRMYRKHRVELEIVSPAGTFRGRKAHDGA